MAGTPQARLHVAGAQKLYTIGQVITQLDSDYPGVTSSKLRFLEDEGLVTPQRTSSGYRKFTQDDIERIRIILELQTRRLPLKYIGEYLEQLDAGQNPGLPGSQEAPELVQRKLRSQKISKLELTKQTGISDGLIAEAQELKLLTSEPFDYSAVEIAKALMSLQRYGIAPRHLRGHKALVDREVSLIEGVVAPVMARNETASRAKAAAYARELEQQFATIRVELINGFIQQLEN